jgi:hypothetical protein
MSPQSTTFSLLTIASFFSSSIALPLDIPQIVPRQAFSIVNVDGSSSPTSTSPLPTVTQTISAISTVTPPASTFIATVNVDRGSVTETIYVTVTPTPQPSPPSTSITPTIPLATGTSPDPCEETPVDDGAPWRHPRIPDYPTGTGAWGTGVAYPTSYPTAAFNAGPVAARPSGMTAPFPVLPADNVPYWFNSTEVPSVRKRVIVS